MQIGRMIIGAMAALTLASCSAYGGDTSEVASPSVEPAPATKALAALPPPPPPTPIAAPKTTAASPAATIINDRATFEKLLGNSGISLQWISFYGADRGLLEAELKGGALHLSGRQKHNGQSGLLELNGHVVQVDKDSFIFDGTIAITGTPDVARTCIKEGKSEFAITQGRKYFRLREFEWCDSLTDYVDVYF